LKIGGHSIIVMASIQVSQDEIIEPIKAMSLNVMFDYSVRETHDFFKRWPEIQKLIDGIDLVMLQEVHESFLDTVKKFARERCYNLVDHLYHKTRKTYLVTLSSKRCMFRSSYIVHASDTDNQMLVVRGAPGGFPMHIGNVHLPFDSKCTGKRIKATEIFLEHAVACDDSIVIGDWNTLPGRGDKDQLKIAADLGEIVPWTMVDNLDVEPLNKEMVQSTFYGFPREKSEYRGFSSPVVFDHLWIPSDQNYSKRFRIKKAMCLHKFITVDEIQMAISDHFPCFFEIHF
jgi:endonuclease/exonuclease/phosphatase family metal-dependent hydrolase